MNNIWSMRLPDIFDKLKTDPVNGLNLSEIESLQNIYGTNSLKEKKNKSILSRFINQFKDAMIIILLIAAMVSFAIACFKGEIGDFVEPSLILFIVTLNATIGVLQEKRAEKAIETLKKLSSPKARVIRNSVESVIDAKFLLPGDIIKLEAGDFIPADARIINSSNLKSEESALTGESVPSEKYATEDIPDGTPLGDRKNMLFSGCYITYGTAIAVVTATGMDTEIGKIAQLIQEEKQLQTPLQRKLADLSKKLGIIALIACFIVFVIGLIDGIDWLNIFMISVSLAVSAIPEGLPAVVTIVLSIGVLQMAKKNAIIRRLSAVETLGSASVICSDKTGTLTQNRMTLTKIYLDNAQMAEDILNISTIDDYDKVKNLLFYASLCSNAHIRTEEGKEIQIGDPTETAIIYAANKHGFGEQEKNFQYERLLEFPFDSDRKLMSTINTINGKKFIITKGAVDMLLPKCTKGNLIKASEINEQLSSQALRVIAVAYKEIYDNLDLEKATQELLEIDLNFMGLLAMIDPPREEAKFAVDTCKKAGIKPVMITGDHISTASAIAKELGIFEDGSRAITGSELESMTDEELSNEIENISVCARVSPQDKIRIVKAFQSRGEVVAMTGDGVNDAPALKAADIGCAMGITGTDVAKESADIVLSDDNFATIVSAVKEGRGIYSNIKKAIAFLLGSNMGEILTVFLSMLFWRQSPLLSMHLLWMNLVTDSFPAIALGMESVDGNIMKQKPQGRNKGIFSNSFVAQLIFCGIMFTAISEFAFYLGVNIAGSVSAGRTMVFMVLSLSQVIHAFNMRSSKSVFKLGIFSNKNLNFAAGISISLILLIVFTPLSKFFGIIYLPIWMYIASFLLILSPIPILELYKVATRRMR